MSGRPDESARAADGTATCIAAGDAFADPHLLLSLRGVAKAYPLIDTGARKFGALWSLLRGRASPAQYVALQGVDLDVYRGESLGVIGVNGAGKSTLLKLIAGVVRASAGELRVRGRVGALLELGAGFHPEYSGRQNVHLACALIGMTKEETEASLERILAFADIGEHIEQPIKHYSSGMVVRLGFAVAATMRPDLLITDEVLAVGDESFQKKCSTWMEQYLADGGTLLLCSHSMYHVQKLCAQAAWIHGGRVHRFGRAGEVTREYLAWHEEQAKAVPPPAKIEQPRRGNAAVYHIEDFWLDGSAAETRRIRTGDDLTVSGTVHSPDGRAPVVASSIVRPDGTPVFGTFSDIAGFRAVATGDGRFGFALRYRRLPLLPGRYKVRGHAMDPEGLRLFDHVERTLEVEGQSRHMGVCLLDHSWSGAAEDLLNGKSDEPSDR